MTRRLELENGGQGLAITTDWRFFERQRIKLCDFRSKQGWIQKLEITVKIITRYTPDKHTEHN